MSSKYCESFKRADVSLCFLSPYLVVIRSIFKSNTPLYSCVTWRVITASAVEKSLFFIIIILYSIIANAINCSALIDLSDVCMSCALYTAMLLIIDSFACIADTWRIGSVPLREDSMKTAAICSCSLNCWNSALLTKPVGCLCLQICRVRKLTAYPLSKRLSLVCCFSAVKWANAVHFCRVGHSAAYGRVLVDAGQSDCFSYFKDLSHLTLLYLVIQNPTFSFQPKKSRVYRRSVVEQPL